MKLEEYLRFYKVSQADFACQLGVSQPYVYFLVSGKRKASKSLAKKIEHITEGRVSTFELLGIDKPEKIITLNERAVRLTK